MAQAAKPKRQNRTITVDFHDETTYSQLLDDGKAFVCFRRACVNHDFQWPTVILNKGTQ
jgi:hypothetical protein